MSHIDEWIKDKPILMAMMALELAFDAEYCFECAIQVKKEEGFIYKLPLPPLNEWLSLYKNHHRIFDLFKDTFVDSNGLVESTQDLTDFLFEGLREIKRTGMEGIREEYNNLNEEEKAAAEKLYQKVKKELSEAIDNIYELQLKDIEADINGEIDDELKNRLNKDINQPEIRFLFKVYNPCFILYRCFPSRLLREARKGEIDYIEKLLRLDRAVIHDKKISDFIHKKSGNKIISDRIATAIANGINEKITRKKIKMNIAGLISFLSTAMGRQLNVVEIRDLFDAIARDKGAGDIDTDIPEGQEAFVKAIQRERRNWDNALRKNKSLT